MKFIFCFLSGALLIHTSGIEVCYDLYSPLIQKVEMIRLEKRLDDDLMYLRDAPAEYSFFPQDMKRELITQKDGRNVPVNPLLVITLCYFNQGFFSPCIYLR